MLPVAMTDLLVGLLSFLFTIMILSYIVGDNPLFRIAIHIFVGVAAGYVFLVVGQQVIVNRLIAPLFSGDLSKIALLIVPLIMSFFLLMKISSRYQGLGRWVVAFMVGVGAAAAIAGALTGTLLPQAWASINLFDVDTFAPGTNAEKIAEGAFILLGTISTLAYFQFSVRESSAKTGKRGIFMQIISFIGEIFLAVTFGALFAGVLSSAITAMVDRMQSIVDFFISLFF
ncbi:MAG: hypothetical protein CVU44_23150 [Chloroflexi bacterium HGW-Chloroflexi-6]|nr:MAG: hypothetical protein CVU44_23150 [Chloroflexi bacterium HGW-Chloroflexi-6]